MGATWHVRGKTPEYRAEQQHEKTIGKRQLLVFQSVQFSSVQFSSVQMASLAVSLFLTPPAQAIGRARHGDGTHVAFNKRVCEWHQFQGLNVVIYSQYRQNFRSSCRGQKTRARGTLIISSTGRSAGGSSLRRRRRRLRVHARDWGGERESRPFGRPPLACRSLTLRLSKCS